jgi:hypothetical protein
MTKITSTERWQHQPHEQSNNNKVSRAATKQTTHRSTNENENTDYNKTISN